MDLEYETTEDVLSTDYEDEAVLVHLESKRCFRLNDTAAAIFRGVAGGLSRREMLARLRESYDVDESTAERELDRVIGELIELRLIRPASSSPLDPGGDDQSEGSGPRGGPGRPV